MENIANKSNKIRKGVKVIAISGNSKGMVGEVLFVLGDRVLVQGINVRKKHMKRSQLNPKGGIVLRETPIHVSNLRVWSEAEKNEEGALSHT